MSTRKICIPIDEDMYAKVVLIAHVQGMDSLSGHIITARTDNTGPKDGYSFVCTSAEAHNEHKQSVTITITITNGEFYGLFL